MGPSEVNRGPEPEPNPVIESDTSLFPTRGGSPGPGLARSFLLDERGMAAPALLRLAELYGLAATDPIDLRNSMRALVHDKIAPNGISLLEEPMGERLDLTRQLGFLDPVPCDREHYQTALVMGGMLDWVRARMRALTEAWNAGVRFDRIVMLTSDRELQPLNGETRQAITDPDNTVLPLPQSVARGADCRDEADLMEFLFRGARLPDTWGRDVPVEWVKTTQAETGGRRVNTADTVRSYLRQAGAGASRGEILIVSSQPFVHYQTVAAASVFEAQRAPFADCSGLGLGNRPSLELAYVNQIAFRLQYELTFRADRAARQASEHGRTSL